MTNRLWAVWVSLGLALGACGGGDEPADEPEPVADTTGDEHVEPDPEPDPEPEPVPTGPGQLTVTNRVGGEDAGGTVQILTASGDVAAEGQSGQTFSVESGQYRVLGQITDDAILVDTPAHELDGMVTVSPGQVTETQIDFPLSRILLNVRRRGRAVRSWRLVVTREGRDPGEPITLTPSREHVPITPGRYSGTLTTGGTEIEVNGLIFQGGATMTVPVNVN